jgi:hypothetical protein
LSFFIRKSDPLPAAMVGRPQVAKDPPIMKSRGVEIRFVLPSDITNGDHFVTEQKLTLEIFEEISNSDDVIEVTGEYSSSFASYGLMHKHHLIE